jgi:hypothetical protein
MHRMWSLILAAAMMITSGPGLAAAAPEAEGPREIEGMVKKVDPPTSTLQVATGALFLAGPTLHVTDATRIVVDGQPAALGDIPKRAKIKASYEVQDGRYIARALEVTRVEPR